MTEPEWKIFLPPVQAYLIGLWLCGWLSSLLLSAQTNTALGSTHTPIWARGMILVSFTPRLSDGIFLNTGRNTRCSGVLRPVGVRKLWDPESRPEAAQMAPGKTGLDHENQGWHWDMV